LREEEQGGCRGLFYGTVVTEEAAMLLQMREVLKLLGVRDWDFRRGERKRAGSPNARDTQ